MSLSQQAVDDFMDIYTTLTGEILPSDVARVRATRFLRLFQMVYQPIPKSYLEQRKGGLNVEPEKKTTQPNNS